MPVKKIFFVISIFTLLHFRTFAHNDKLPHINYEIIINDDAHLSKLQTVFICSGPYSYAYHSRSNCSGLNNCKGNVTYTDEYTAVNSLRRKPCCKCWSNVNNNCKDDSNVASGGGGDPEAALALIVVVASAVILSNDFYFYPTFSIHRDNNKIDEYGQEYKFGNGTGWSFGFRKTFKHSALEYGLSYLNYDVNYTYGAGLTSISNLNRWGWHFNYVHQLFYNKTPNRIKVYLGPSINYVYDFGYGGLLGTEIKLFDRLKVDFRYELTSQTNQFQAGLIFTYQKKYFWKK